MARTRQQSGLGRPSATLVEKVGDQVPKLGYDVKVVLADGKQVHIEAKASAGDGSLVALEEGERAHKPKLRMRV